MPSILSRRKDGDEEPYVRPSLSLQLSRTGSIASDATAPNNPGPGRNVGLLFDAIGGRIEHAANKMAARINIKSKEEEIFSSREEFTPSSSGLPLIRTESIASDATAPNNPGPGRTIGLLFDHVGEKIERYANEKAGQRRLGPQAIVEDIRQLQHVRRQKETLFFEVTGEEKRIAPTDEEYVFLKKRCRKMLKYCRSHVRATQLEALEAVSELAVKDPYVRQVFASILHHSYFIRPKYKEQDVYIQSCKALVSVKENEIYDFFLHMRDTFSLEQFQPRQRYADQELIYPHFAEKLEFLLKDPDVSFLLGRLLLSSGFGENHLERRSQRVYYNVAKTSPHLIEWDTLRRLYWSSEFVLDNNNDDDYTLPLARNFTVLELFGFGTDPWLSGDAQTHKDGTADRTGTSTNPARIVNVLENLCGSRGLTEQLRYLEELDEETWSLFQGTVFANDILIAYAHARKDCEFDTMTGTPCLITSSQTADEAFEVLLSRFHFGNMYQQTLAEEAIARLLAFGRYVKSVVSQFGEAFYTVPLYPRNKRALARREILNNSKCKLSESDVDTNDILLYEEDTWLNIVGTEYPFDPTGHFPVLVGLDTSGNELYVAQAGGQYSCVSDGARDISIVDALGEVRRFRRFQVLVLRHDPSDVIFRDIPKGAKYPTGYAYWIRDEVNLYKNDSRELDASKFSWVEEEINRGARLGEVVEPDEPSDEDDALDGIAELFSLETFAESTIVTSRTIDHVSSQTDTDGGFVQDFVPAGVENQKDMSEGPDQVIEEMHLVESDLQELQRSSSHQAAIDEKKRQIAVEMQALADRMRDLEEERRKLELGEMSAAPWED